MTKKCWFNDKVKRIPNRSFFYRDVDTVVILLFYVVHEKVESDSYRKKIRREKNLWWKILVCMKQKKNVRSIRVCAFMCLYEIEKN